ncbi:Calpain-12 [Camelus dromedarius]|uniref:Calpain-12 n=1 Tax=Camelus dromedarius TaxID=9838 RepID=A0A5N4DQD6_CAMDR|nr:Calpain-12 [Camelus dromedarius]
MACGSRRVTIQLVNEEAGPGTRVPKLFRGQNYNAIRAACLDEGILFQDPYFPAGPDSLGYNQLGPNSKKAKGVEWKRPHLWQFGHWVDVVVDDRLPVREGKLVFVRSAQRNEFWAPLLEKAYAKLHGSYEVMRGGHMNEAFVDFTGGVGEVLYLRQGTPGLFSALRHALAKESLVGATALSDRGEYRTEDGLVKGHAYSVTGTHKVSLGFTKVRLLRLRNPWGSVEWTGAWSDSCPRWDALPTEWRDALLVKKEDGEFWMELQDFLQHFDTVQVCSLSPEVLGPSPAGGGWHVHTFQGRWVRGFNSGGSQPGAETFWTNPQFRLTLLEPDEEEEEDDEGPCGGWGAVGARGPARGCRIPKCTVLLSLIQRNRRRLRAQGLTYLTVGFHVFQIPEESRTLAEPAARRPLALLRPPRRELPLPLRPGHYLVVPSAAHTGDEADFTLRIFSERLHTALEIDDVISADLHALMVPYIPLELGLEQLFLELAGEHGRSLALHQFQQLWGHLLEWQFDEDASGTMNSYELRLALNAAGFHLNNQLTQVLTSRYRDSRLRVDFEHFVSCLAQLICIFRE